MGAETAGSVRESFIKETLNTPLKTKNIFKRRGWNKERRKRFYKVWFYLIIIYRLSTYFFVIIIMEGSWHFIFHVLLGQFARVSMRQITERWQETIPMLLWPRCEAALLKLSLQVPTLLCQPPHMPASWGWPFLLLLLWSQALWIPLYQILPLCIYCSN